MTHDELMSKIDKELICYCGHLDLCDGIASKEQAPSWYALRAVVELHKPFTEREDGLIICNVACNDEGGYLEPYPCKTIQAIEKELQ